MMELFTPLGVPQPEIVFFVSRLLTLATSCTERRFAEYENIRWWDFIQAPRMSRAYLAYFKANPELALRRSIMYQGDSWGVGMALARGLEGPNLKAELDSIALTYKD